MMAHGVEYGYEAILPDIFEPGKVTDFKSAVLPEHSTIGFGMADVDEAGFEIPYTPAEQTVQDLRAEALKAARSKRARK